MKRNIIVILSIIVLAAIATLVYLRFVRSSPTTQTTQTNTAVVGTNTNSPINTNVNPTTDVDTPATPQTNAGQNQDTAIRIARTVIERYGSYTSHNDYQNLTSVLPFMTARLQSITQKFIDDSKKTASSDDAYYSISTKVLSIKATAFTADATATVETTTNRIEVRENGEPNQFTQTAVITLVFSDASWKVDIITWK